MERAICGNCKFWKIEKDAFPSRQQEILESANAGLEEGDPSVPPPEYGKCRAPVSEEAGERRFDMGTSGSEPCRVEINGRQLFEPR
jgi:hypothetical protein